MSEFDSFAHDYEYLHSENIKISGFPPSYFDEYKIREMADYFVRIKKKHEGIRILNFGCGIGKSEKYIRRYFPGSIIYSTDVSEKSLELAKKKNKEMKDLFYGFYDGDKLPFDVSFDVIFIANVFHHIPRPLHIKTLCSLKKIMASEGLIFLFEHNPLNPLTVKTVNACPFDDDAVLLSPLYTNRIIASSGLKCKSVRFILFFPKFMLALIPMEKYLQKIPLGAQYYCIASNSIF